MIDPDPHEIGLADSNEFSESLLDLDPEETAICGPEDQTRVIGVDEGVHKWIGKKLGHFKLLRPLGEGGMGMVVQAMDTNLDRIVALKVLRKRIKGMDDDRSVRQFLREARAAAKLDHPNAAHIYEINEHMGWWYIASEMIEGGTLEQVVKSAGKLPPAAACPLIADAASLLTVAHRLNIIHRDIKPHNLMLTRDGRCKVVDFGLVRWEDPNDPFDFTRRAVGTPHYLPPEAEPGCEPTGAYDIYSLGATLYYALTGQPPFKGTKLKEIVEQHRHAPRPDPRDLNPECSERLALLVQRALAIDPDKRPTATDLAASLRLENVGLSVDPASLVIDPHTAARAAAENRSGLTGLSGALTGSSTQRTHMLSSSGQTLVLTRARPLIWMWIVRIAAVLLILFAVAAAGKWAVDSYRQSRTNSQALPAEAFTERFPDAPESYGTRPPGQFAAPPAQLKPPPFSWVGRVDPDENQFVSSQLGQTAYPLDHPLAGLIPAAQVEFYADASAVRAAGKQLAILTD